MKRGLLTQRVPASKLAGIGLVLVFTLLLLPTAQAGVPPEPADWETVATGVAAPLWDDGGAWEIGAEGAGGSLSAYACSEASYLTNRLTSNGWTSRYLWCGANAWEEDFKKGPTGTEANWLDTVDLAFYVGHGWTGGFQFDSLHDDGELTPGDCNYAWGDGDNEWVALTSCQVLSNPNRANWAACMKGTHQVLGFVTNAAARMGTSTQGYQFAYYLTNSWTVTGAWFKACDVSQPAGRVVRVLGEELDSFNDRPIGAWWAPQYISSDYWDYDYYWWDHVCGSPEPKPVDIAALQGVMPVFRTPPLSLAEAQGESTELGTAFQIPPPGRVTAAGSTAACAAGEIWRSMTADGRELEMSCENGLYTYYDVNMWSAPAAQRALAAADSVTVSPADARTIAEAFLRQNNLMPADAVFEEVTADTIATQPVTPTLASAVVPAAETVWQVIYGRVVTATVASGTNAPAVDQSFQVVGPGGKLKVYVPTTAIRSAKNALPVSGVIGGWRTVQTPTATNRPTGIATVPILDEAQILKLHEQVPTFVTLNTPPIAADATTVISTTLGEWEEGVIANQRELIPVYSLKVEYYKNNPPGQPVLLTTDWAYIPANEMYMRPYAEIIAPPPPDGKVAVGDTITLEAADATKTLSDLGYDQSLNFALGSGIYVYDWYVDSIAPGNRIGGGRVLQYKVRADVDPKVGELTQRIILRVTDSESADQLTTTDETSITVKPRVALPLVLR